MPKFTADEAGLPGVLLVRPTRFGDARGYFMETYERDAYAALGIGAVFVQDNQSLSATPGTLRGLHFQTEPFAQAKLVRVLRGAIFDVAVDIRLGSPTYAHWCGARLTADGAEQLFVPRGFAHGFVTLEPMTEVAYKVDAPYSAACDGGIAWNDPQVAVEWPWPTDGLTLSAKDQALPTLAAKPSPFTF